MVVELGGSVLEEETDVDVEETDVLVAVVAGLEVDEVVDDDPPRDVVLDPCDVAEPFVPVEHAASATADKIADDKITSAKRKERVPAPRAKRGIRS
ncbi:MAG: hypothetical protein ACLP6E_12340 [Acidimicrobiales bacterium]